jgi:4-hydroxy-tetrahydrodipicolinate synthase
MSKYSNLLSGTGVALVTPFKSDGQIDFLALKKLVKHIIKRKCEYLVPLGTTGESVTLSEDEKKAVVDCVIQTNDGKLPIVMGLGGNNTQELLWKLEKSDFSGITALLSVSPYYNKPSQVGIIAHFSLLAQESPLPIILYNVPGRTGSNMTAETTLALANSQKNIIGIKEASGNMDQIMEIIRSKPKDFLVISGDDGITMPLIAAGANGVISVVANAFPKGFSDMVRFALQSENKKAAHLHYKYLPLVPLLFAEGSPSGIKCALKEMGIMDEHVRMPVVKVSNGLAQKIISFVKSNK